MHKECILFYRVCADYLEHKGFRDDPQARMTTVEVLTTALVAAWCFANNLRAARNALAHSGLILYMLSESRLNRRWHQITSEDWQAILTLLAARYPAETYLVDSCPFAVCHNQRAYRSRLYPDANGAYWGHCAAKDESFYGLRAHTIVTESGRPVEVLLLCGCAHDLTGFKEMDVNLPQGSRLLADKAYTDYELEDTLKADKQITFLPLRKRNLKRQHDPKLAKQIRYKRKRIETTFSEITAKLPHRLHAVTPEGFEHKVLAIFVAYAIIMAHKELQQTNDG
jgi:Transposase DDE domain